MTLKPGRREKPVSNNTMKFAGIGWHKTGTTTLCHCMREFGFAHRSWEPEDFELWNRGEIGQLMEIAANHESCDDFPWPFLFRELDERFPGTKFILTLRKDPETWFGSIRKHAERTGPLDYREWVYGRAMPHDDPERFLEAYNGHNESVRDYFRNRPGDLLEVCWENGDGWPELAAFLGREVPAREFPHANRSPVKQQDGAVLPEERRPEQEQSS